MIAGDESSANQLAFENIKKHAEAKGLVARRRRFLFLCGRRWRTIPLGFLEMTRQTLDKQGKLLTFGWREWVQLPELGIAQIKAKVDTGARTSALHAFQVRPYTEDGRDRVEFLMHPVQKDNETVITCNADIIDTRKVTDSGGHSEQRYVIRTELHIGSHHWPIEATLTSRDDMLFRMLLGRTALKGRAQVNPARSYAVGKKKVKKTMRKE